MPANSTTEASLSPRRAQTRQRLIDAAGQAVGEKGFQATTLDEIAAKAGLTKGAIYDNFASKEELFLALVGQRPVGPEWPEGRDGSVKQRLRRLARLVIEENEATRQLAPLRAEFLLYSLTHAQIRAQMPALVERQIKMTEARILELFSPGELPLPVREFAILLENLIPSLVYTRALAPKAITERAVIAIFESFSTRD